MTDYEIPMMEIIEPKAKRDKAKIATASLITLWAASFIGFAVGAYWWAPLAMVVPWLVIVPLGGAFVLFTLACIVAVFTSLWKWALGRDEA